jgi:hypothetical protein
MGLIHQPELTREPRVKSELLYFRMALHFSLSMIWPEFKRQAMSLC